MGIHMSNEEIEALYASIHRLALKHIPECTLEQARKVARGFHDRDATRLDYALKIHWQLVEDRISSHPAKKFLDMLEREVQQQSNQKPTYKVRGTSMEGFKVGDKVIKRTEKDARNYGKVMDRENTEMFRKPGYIAVYFNRQVWIKPENLMHFDEWKRKQQKAAPQKDIKNYWMEG